MICRMEALVLWHRLSAQEIDKRFKFPCFHFWFLSYMFILRLSPIFGRCRNDIKANQIKYLTTFCACAHGTKQQKKRIEMPLYQTHSQTNTHMNEITYGNKEGRRKKLKRKKNFELHMHGIRNTVDSPLFSLVFFSLFPYWYRNSAWKLFYITLICVWKSSLM